MLQTRMANSTAARIISVQAVSTRTAESVWMATVVSCRFGAALLSEVVESCRWRREIGLGCIASAFFARRPKASAVAPRPESSGGYAACTRKKPASLLAGRPFEVTRPRYVVEMA